MDLDILSIIIGIAAGVIVGFIIGNIIIKKTIDSKKNDLLKKAEDEGLKVNRRIYLFHQKIVNIIT